MWAVWGAPTHWTQYTGLISSLIAVTGAFGLLISGTKGQQICALGVVGMGSFYIPAVQSLIPAENTIISPFSYVILTGYLTLLAGVTLYPMRIKGAVGIIGIAMLAMCVWASVTAFNRWKEGEFNRPQIVGFLASRSAEPLILQKGYDQLIPVALRDGITQAGIGGLLAWHSGSGDEAGKPKVVVIATSRITTAKKLRYPKEGILLYVWNGDQWASFPSNVDCYSAFATLQVDGMLSNELTTGGVQSYYFFPWQKSP